MNLKKEIRKGIVLLSGLVFTLFLNAQHVNEAKIENCEVKVNKNEMQIECDNKDLEFKVGLNMKIPNVYDSTLFTYEHKGIKKIGIFYTETTGKAGACAINVRKSQPFYNCNETELDTKKGEITKIERNVKHKSNSFTIKGHEKKILIRDSALNRK
jgi:hypothetical protein